MLSKIRPFPENQEAAQMGRAYQNRKESMAKTAAAKTKVYSNCLLYTSDAADE